MSQIKIFEKNFLLTIFFLMQTVSLDQKKQNQAYRRYFYQFYQGKFSVEFDSSLKLQQKKCKECDRIKEKVHRYNDGLSLLSQIIIIEIKMSEHSDEEGFFPNKIQIKRYSYKNMKSSFFSHKSGPNGVMFSARYLSGNGFMKKQPPEAIQEFQYCSINSQKNKTEKKKKNSFQFQHPYQQYANNENYHLIYKKTKGEPLSFENEFIKNEIVLEHLGKSGSSASKGIKEFNDTNQTRKQQSLVIDSRFESGNLHCAYKNSKQHEYIGFIQNDTNSLGYNQWFYFSVENNKAKVPYLFRLVNFKKKHSFFKYGYLPAIFSRKQAQKTGIGWSRMGKNVIYEQSPIQVSNKTDTRYYCLSFQLTFQHDNDFILIAMGLPYSYSKMMKFVNQALLFSNKANLDVSITSLTKSVCGNDVPELTITSKEGSPTKKVIVIMARQHPGQVWSSYMVEGMIKSFIDPKQQQKWLLHNYIIKIYPMINVDGVIYGNFRCDITGVDLNRRWKDPSRILHPQIYHIKKKIAEYHRKYKIDLCYDLHGHSKEYNIFCYSCKTNVYSCRILPLIISKLNPNFYFPSCTFGISPYKQTTARACIFKIIQNENVLTIESSFYGSRLHNQIRNFQPKDMYQMAEDILKGSRHFLDKKGKRYANAKKEIEEKIKQFLEYDKANQNNSGSDSQPQADQIDFQTKACTIFNKNLVQNGNEEKQEKKEENKEEKKFKMVKKKTKILISQKEYEEDENIEVEKEEEKPNPLYNNKIVIKQVARNHSRTIDTDKKEDKNTASNKITISYSQKKQQKSKKKTVKNMSHEEKKSKLLFRQNKGKFSINSSYDQAERKISEKIMKKGSNDHGFYKNEDDRMERKQSSEKTESISFAKRFQKFIPFSLLSHKAQHFHQNLYNEDQSYLIQTLLENKRKIEVEKIKRDVQQSTYIVERQGKIKSKGQKKDYVVDFRRFKEKQKFDRQIRTLNPHQRYLE